MKFNFLAFILMNFLQLRKLLKSELNQIRMECSSHKVSAIQQQNILD